MEGQTEGFYPQGISSLLREYLHSQGEYIHSQDISSLLGNKVPPVDKLNPWGRILKLAFRIVIVTLP
jgi:hypothetical protein